MGGVKVDMPWRIEVSPRCPQKGKLVGFDVGDRDEEDTAGGKPLGGPLDDQPRLGQMLQAMPERDGVKALLQLGQGGGGIGRLQRPNADAIVEEVYAVLVDFDGGDVKSGILRVAAEGAYPRADFEQFAGALVAQKWVDAIKIIGGNGSEFGEAGWDLLIAALVEGPHVVRNGIHKNKTAAVALKVLKRGLGGLSIEVLRSHQVSGGSAASVAWGRS